MTSSSDRNSPTPGDMSRRRSSVTQATLSNLFQRSNSISCNGGTPAFPGAMSSATMTDQRRRLSLSTGAGIGLSGTSPNSTFLRRASLSTNASEAIDEHAVEEDDGPAPRSPFQRRMSFGAGPPRGQKGVPPSPGTNDQGFNWSEQLRFRAESLTGSNRPNWGVSGSGHPSRGVAAAAHERARSVGEMPPPPASMRPPPAREAAKKPDAFQERILKGDFYMD